MQPRGAPRTLQWLALADLVYLAGGAIAYWTTVSDVLLAVIALIPAIPGLAAARQAVQGEQAHVWADRALSAATGTFAVAAMLIMIPYMAAEGGRSLWSLDAFWALGVGATGLGFLLWNASAFQALAGPEEIANGRLYAGFHLLLVVAAVVLAWTGDGGTHLIGFRGEEVEARDLAAAPAVAAAPGLVWAAAFLRMARAPPPPGT